MLFANPRAVRTPYPIELHRFMNIAQARESRAWLSSWKGLTPGATPLYELPDLAAELGVARIAVKDESVRSPLGSFKALGAPVALVRLILRLHPDRGLEPTAILSGRYAGLLHDCTVISATDGNHGRSLAAAARDAGCRCVIVLHAKVSSEREQAIAAYGAQIVRVAGNYDDSVREAARLACENGWQVVSDTSYDGYQDIPRDVMQGYATIADELVEQTGARPGEPSAFTHVLLQGGVGGLAAGIVSYLWEFHGARRPHFVVVEPDQADCLLQSAIAGRAATATGSAESVMAGLACGETSPLAWRYLQPAVDDFLTIDDAAIAGVMRRLANGSDRDIPLVAGESGAAGFAGLLALRGNADWARRTQLDADARVLLINTEGATAPAIYEELAGQSAETVLRRQAAWKDAATGL